MNTQKWSCWVVGWFHFLGFEETPSCFSLRLQQSAIPPGGHKDARRQGHANPNHSATPPRAWQDGRNPEDNGHRVLPRLWGKGLHVSPHAAATGRDAFPFVHLVSPRSRPPCSAKPDVPLPLGGGVGDPDPTPARAADRGECDSTSCREAARGLGVSPRLRESAPCPACGRDATAWGGKSPSTFPG